MSESDEQLVRDYEEAVRRECMTLLGGRDISEVWDLPDEVTPKGVRHHILLARLLVREYEGEHDTITELVDRVAGLFGLLLECGYVPVDQQIELWRVADLIESTYRHDETGAREEGDSPLSGPDVVDYLLTYEAEIFAALRREPGIDTPPDDNEKEIE